MPTTHRTPTHPRRDRSRRTVSPPLTGPRAECGRHCAGLGCHDPITETAARGVAAIELLLRRRPAR